MRYIAKKVEDGYEISGLKELKTEKGDLVEVIIDTKVYTLEALNNNLKVLEEERTSFIEQYNVSIDDIKSMIEAIDKVK